MIPRKAQPTIPARRGQFASVLTLRSMFAARTNWNLAPNRYTEAVEAARHEGRTLLDLTASNPTSIGFAYERERILGALQHENALQY